MSTTPTPAPVPTPDEVATPRTDTDDRIYPLPEHAQHIVFEGCDSVVMSPEAYEALYEHALTLERELLSAQAALAQAKAELQRYSAEAVGQVAKLKSALAQAQKDKERLDWLAEQNRRERAAIPENNQPEEGVTLLVFREHGECDMVDGETFRAAIDTARAEQEGGGHE